VFDPSTYYDLISGRRRGLKAAAMRTAMAAVEPFYGLAIRYRNRRYDRGREKIHKAAVPVISVGNLTLGGTGKTPMVKWIARWLRNRDLRVALISRGYGSQIGSRNDEALELEHALPDVPHLQNPDRVAMAQIAIEEFATQVILLDDGFQHRRLARDLDIVLLDATQPFGFGHLIPRGTLREPVSSLGRAHVVCLSRADQIDAAHRDEIRQRMAQIAPQAALCEAAHAPLHLLTADGASEPLEQLHGKRVAAFCGIGNPGAFRRTLESLGCEVVAWREFPDHYSFTSEDIKSLSNWANAQTIDTALCTHKDLVKLQLNQLGDRPLRAIVVEMAILSGQTELEVALSRAVANIKPPDTLKSD
jgi:tetraacyldisaccharide 4'-kinase